MPHSRKSLLDKELTKRACRGTSTTRLYARCILFDLDGTLYESSEYSKRLEEEIVKVVSEELSLDEDHAKLLLKRKRKEIGTLPHYRKLGHRSEAILPENFRQDRTEPLHFTESEGSPDH